MQRANRQPHHAQAGTCGVVRLSVRYILESVRWLMRPNSRLVTFEREEWEGLTTVWLLTRT